MGRLAWSPRPGQLTPQAAPLSPLLTRSVSWWGRSRPVVALIAALHLLTLGCVPALIASGAVGSPGMASGRGSIPGPAGALLVADGSVCAKALVAAASKLGSTYGLGAKGPDAFDCSGYTRWSYQQAGVVLGLSTYEQINEGQHTPCRYEDFHGATTTCWQPGDLLFLQYPEAGAPNGMGQHVALYDHDGYIVGCENPTVGCIRQMPERNRFYQQWFAMGRRIANCAAQPAPVGIVVPWRWRV